MRPRGYNPKNASQAAALLAASSGGVVATRWKADAANQPVQKQNHLLIGYDRAPWRKRPPHDLIDAALEHVDRGAWASIEGQVLAGLAGVEQLPTGTATDHLRVVDGNLRIRIIGRQLIVDRQVNLDRPFHELHPGHRGPAAFGLGPALGFVHFGSVDGERRARCAFCQAATPQFFEQ